MRQANHRQTNRARKRRRLYALLLVLVVAAGVTVLLNVHPGAERDASSASPGEKQSSIVTGAATTVGNGSSGSVAIDTTTASVVAAATPTADDPEQATNKSTPLPSTLPADAVKVHVPILMYHYVDDMPPPAGPYADSLTVRTDDFEQEIQYLVENDYHTVSFADVYLAMAGQEELPSKPVVLTFDDGGLDNYEVAFPILKEHGLVSTFFVITGSVGKEGQMTWDQLREMAAQGMSIQSHTVSHPDLQGISASKLESQLVDSSQAIAEAIGEPSYVLSYPSGSYNAEVIVAARAAGYVMAVATDKGSEGDPAAVYEITRRRIQAFVPLTTFANLLQ